MGREMSGFVPFLTKDKQIKSWVRSTLESSAHQPEITAQPVTSSLDEAAVCFPILCQLLQRE